MSTKAKRLVSGSLLRVVEFSLIIIVGLAMTPFFIKVLGDEAYGLWIFVGAFLGYYGLMDFGLNLAVQRFVSRAIGLKDYDEVNKVVNTSLVIFLCIGLFSFFITLLIAFLGPFLFKNITDISTFKLAIIILGINLTD